MELEKKEINSSVLLPRVPSEHTPLQQGEAENKTYRTRDSPLTFRGEPIAWVSVPKTTTEVQENLFGDDEIDEQTTGVRHLIQYQDKALKRSDFLAMVFPEYRKYPYKVKFKTDDIFRLGGN